MIKYNIIQTGSNGNAVIYNNDFENVIVNSDRWFSLENLKNEKWKDIKNYENLYQISNYGRVKSLKIKNENNRHQKTKILKQCINQGGYYIVNLSNKSARVHRLVGLNFIDNPKNYKVLNHIDGNKQNNKINNLEWCNSSYNNKEAYRLGLKVSYFKDKKGKYSVHKNLKKIIQYDMNKNKIETFYGTGEIKRKYGYAPICILNCCKSKQKQAYGFIWRYEGEVVKNEL